MQDKANTENIEAWRKKLLFRSWHRGTREMDLLMGRFAEAHVGGFDAPHLEAYETLLKENDPDLYNWLIGKEAWPERVNGVIAEELRNFYREK